METAKEIWRGMAGKHRAVFVYQIESYRYWQNQLGRNDFTYGQFGENFTIEGLADTECASAIITGSAMPCSK
jgi:MOSC domain-containing protein YiiM